MVFTLAPSRIGYQDVASQLARQPAVSAHWRQHVRASAFGSIRAATFSFPRPIGTAMPQPLSYRLPSFDPREVRPGSRPDAPHQGPRPDEAPLEFPKVDRSTKGDRLPIAPKPEIAKIPEQPQLKAPSPAPLQVEAAAPAAETLPAQSTPLQAAANPDPPIPFEPAQQPPAAIPSAPAAAAEPKIESEEAAREPSTESAEAPDPVDAAKAVKGITAEADDFTPAEPAEPVVEMARLYFGDKPLGDELAEIEKWAPGEEPIIAVPPPADPDIKLSALNPRHPVDRESSAAPDQGESVAGKGQVTGEDQRPKTPAERLGLDGKARAKAEKCLADAIYFEARGEPVRGQMAVAQVVMNRVFSGYYPSSICATVYQNAHRRLACQFTFACDGIPESVTEPQAWLRATQIARDYLDGKYWVAEVDRATHYHAYWVRPVWVREMKRLYKFGVHTFYRPRAWGDGADVPSWGTVEATKEAAAKL